VVKRGEGLAKVCTKCYHGGELEQFLVDKNTTHPLLFLTHDFMGTVLHIIPEMRKQLTEEELEG